MMAMKGCTRAAMTLAGTPLLLWYSNPSKALLISTCIKRGKAKQKTYRVWLGKPETGIPIPVEQTSQVVKMSRFTCYRGPGRLVSMAVAISEKKKT
jgi:hypothetical protein